MNRIIQVTKSMSLDVVALTLTIDSETIPLTPRQWAVMFCLCDSIHSWVSSHTLASHLPDLLARKVTLSYAISELRDKLEPTRFRLQERVSATDRRAKDWRLTFRLGN